MHIYYDIIRAPIIVRNLVPVPAKKHPDESHPLPRRDARHTDLRRREMPSSSSVSDGKLIKACIGIVDYNVSVLRQQRRHTTLDA
jgi:hypothetical protein